MLGLGFRVLEVRAAGDGDGEQQGKP